jgi:hypothetical protein
LAHAIQSFNAHRQNPSYNWSDDDRASFKSFSLACGNMRLATYFGLYGPDQVSFDDFWEEIGKDSRIAIAENYIKDNLIIDYRLRIKEDFDYLINTFIRKNGRGPLIEEVKDSLVDLFSTPFYLCLKIRQIHFTTVEAKYLAKKVYKILKRRVPKKRFCKDDLERYLKVYDHREAGLAWKKISEKVFPEENYGEIRRNALRKDFKKAQMIIRNVEKGLQLYW